MATINGTSGNDHLVGFDTADTINGFGGDDILQGRGGDDTLNGGDDDDILDGDGGADSMTGGAGNDSYRVDHAGDHVEESSAAGGHDTVTSSISFTLPIFFEDLRLIGSAALNGTGNAGANAITGNADSNRLTGLDGNDQLRGDRGNDVLIGGAGGDMLNGGPGDDRMEGGSGNDTYVVTSNLDRVIESSAANGTDLVKSSLSYVLGDHLENLELIGDADIWGRGNGLGNRITGNDGDNELSGVDGNDILDGGRGSDLLRGGAGDDQYYVNILTDQIVEGAFGGTDTVYTSIPFTPSARFTLPDQVENAVMRGVSNAGAVGNWLDNVMKGNSGHNVLLGEGGNDTLVGNSGDDTLEGGVDIDTLLGGDGDDYLMGGHHYLDQDDVEDVLRGGAGDDFYDVDAADDILESAGGGIDTVRTGSSYTLPDHFENLQFLLGDAALVGIGNGEDNIITGNNGDNDLQGLGGNDVIEGRDGQDVLHGGGGDDRLTGHRFQDEEKADILFGEDGADILFGATMNGGAGEDRFRVRDDVHTIEDFVSADDRIDLSWQRFFVTYNGYGERSGELLERGQVPESAFAYDAPQDADDYVVYDTNTGTLYIDEDGNGAGEAYAIAILVGAPTLTAGDLFVVGSGTW